MKTVVLPDTLTAINANMFSSCGELTTVMHISSTDINVLSDNIVSIGNGAFEGCTKINKLFIFENVLTVGATAFWGWNSNQTIDIYFYEPLLPNTWHIDWYQGSNATIEFREILPVWVTFDFEGGTGGTPIVEAFAFSPMPSATAPTRVGYVFAGYFCGQFGTGTKYYNANMTSATNWDQFNNTTLYAYWTDLYIYQLNTSTMEYMLIGIDWNHNAFFNTITHLEIPSEYNGLPVTIINHGVFYGRGNLVSVIMPDTILHIGNSAFDGCHNLVYIKLSENLLSIGNMAFFRAERLESIILPSSLISLGNEVFWFCSNLKYLSIPSNVSAVGYRLFHPTSRQLTVYTEFAPVPPLLPAPQPPIGWNRDWNWYGHPVFWGCTFSADKSYVVSFLRAPLNLSGSGTITAPYREGFTFGGWQDIATGIIYPMHQLFMPVGATSYAVWL
ncbi:MAG: leucine-rich repeat protein [Firmicutes bacterium]|nr:leucine-rich repeat protein [Bacillota bacterium]